MRKASKDWIVVDTKKGGAFVCNRCGDEYRPAMPINIKDYLVLCKSFTSRHSKCKELNKEMK